MWPIEVQLAVVNATMKRMANELMPLFESWQLSPETQNEVLGRLRELETEQMENYVKHLEDGLGGTAKVKADNAVDEAVTDFRLETLVGAAHSAELLEARREFLSRRSIRGIEAANAKTTKR